MKVRRRQRLLLDKLETEIPTRFTSRPAFAHALRRGKQVTLPDKHLFPS